MAAEASKEAIERLCFFLLFPTISVFFLLFDPFFFVAVLRVSCVASAAAFSCRLFRQRYVLAFRLPSSTFFLFGHDKCLMRAHVHDMVAHSFRRLPHYFLTSSCTTSLYFFSAACRLSMRTGRHLSAWCRRVQRPHALCVEKAKQPLAPIPCHCGAASGGGRAKRLRRSGATAMHPR